MKFIVSSSVLLKNLMTINGVVATNPIVPILENFLFRIEDGTLTVTASDLQTTMVVQVPIQADGSGAIAVPAKLLTDTLKSLPKQPVTVNDASEKLMCEYDGEDMEIGFNGKLLAEMLANQDAKIIGLHMSAPNRAGLLIPVDQEDGEDILALVMPVVLNTYA